LLKFLRYFKYDLKQFKLENLSVSTFNSDKDYIVIEGDEVFVRHVKLKRKKDMCWGKEKSEIERVEKSIEWFE